MKFCSADGVVQGLSQAIINLQIDEIGSLVDLELKKGRDAFDLLMELRQGMEEVGRKFENSDCFLADLILAGETMKRALEVLKPSLESAKAQHVGKVVIGTIWGDLHDIGKEIVNTLLISAGFEVSDLGIDVRPEMFAEEARKSGAEVVGVSALLSTSVPTISKVVEALGKVGMRDRVRVIAGGAALRKHYAGQLGIDAAVNDAVEGIEIVKSWVAKAER